MRCVVNGLITNIQRVCVCVFYSFSAWSWWRSVSLTSSLFDWYKWSILVPGRGRLVRSVKCSVFLRSALTTFAFVDGCVLFKNVLCVFQKRNYPDAAKQELGLGGNFLRKASGVDVRYDLLLWFCLTVVLVNTGFCTWYFIVRSKSMVVKIPCGCVERTGLSVVPFQR